MSDLYVYGVLVSSTQQCAPVGLVGLVGLVGVVPATLKVVPSSARIGSRPGIKFSVKVNPREESPLTYAVSSYPPGSVSLKDDCVVHALFVHGAVMSYVVPPLWTTTSTF